MKLTEQQKENLCDLIEKSLNNSKLNRYVIDSDCDTDYCPLVDFLSNKDENIKGEEEIENIVIQISEDMDDWDI